ncbi:hypothetical protein [Saliphagus sp. LR7]|uniref:hypothetical protein n=1 Tax=Saliphagus sp. LR7 TaxID=2282654 RepID=UPI000DF815BC|nr:hypothetical protein [Saliphagus sp. LR7]
MATSFDNPTREYDESTDSFGRAVRFSHETGSFARVREDGPVRVIDGPTMVGRQLARTLLTAQGEDPLRPEFGIDPDQALGESDLQTKEAIRDAIGPDADPRVQRLEPSDIEINRPRGDRENATVRVTVHLTNGEPAELGAGSEWWRWIGGARS